MKRLSFFVPLLAILIAASASFWFVGCESQLLEPVTNSAVTPLNKVTVVEYSYDIDLGEFPPYENCVTGEPMLNHGIVKVYVTEKTTPSGTWTATAYLDYNAYGGVTLENTTTGEVWTLKNGTNPSNEVAKENGVYRLHYHWNETYTLNNKNLHIHGQGFYTIDKNGNVTKDIYSYKCN